MNTSKLKQVDAAWKKYVEANTKLDQQEWELYLQTIHNLDKTEITYIRERLLKFFS